MSDVRITCILKSQSHGGCEHITDVGNPAGNWMWPVKQVIESIDAKTNTFFVLDPATGKRAEVGVVRPTDGRKPYLRTYADGYWNDNLLSLTTCPYKATA